MFANHRNHIFSNEFNLIKYQYLVLRKDMVKKVGLPGYHATFLKKGQREFSTTYKR